MFSTIAYAQDAGGATGGTMGTLYGLMPLILMFVVFYFLLIRPQQKRQKALNETINNLKTGDQVLTASGFFATVDSVIDANTFMLNLGGGIKVKAIRSAIAAKIDPTSGTIEQGKK